LSSPHLSKRWAKTSSAGAAGQRAAVAPVGLTLWCAAAGSAAVQSATALPLGSGFPAGQAVPPLRAAPRCQSQAFGLVGVPFRRVDPGFPVSLCPGSCGCAPTIAWPPAVTLTRSRLSRDTAAIPKCGGWGVLAFLAVLAEVLTQAAEVPQALCPTRNLRPT
jgi:hypothetical protein